MGKKRSRGLKSESSSAGGSNEEDNNNGDDSNGKSRETATSIISGVTPFISYFATSSPQATQLNS